KLGQMHPNQKIIIVDAQLAGEGASSRNSGYLVDTTLNDGFTSNKELDNYKKKTDIYDLGINTVKKFINDYQVDCDWNECGKYFASSRTEDKKILTNFSKTLSKLGFEHNLLSNNELSKRLGTNFYDVALNTKGGVLLHPGKLVRAMVDVLPKNVCLFENSSLLSWNKTKDTISCEFKIGKINTKKIIFATNGFLKSLGIKSNYNFPLTLTASMTRPLTEDEFKSIGKPKEWGVLPVKPMGATIRMTKDRRILIRNTAEVYNLFKMSKFDLQKRSINQKIGIKKRFPQLPEDIIQSSWSGVVSRTRNSSQIFEKIDKNIFAAGCYNGSGIGVGTLFGEQIAMKASEENTEEIQTIEARNKPTWLPPQPFLNLGVKTRLIYERLRARSEI
ncbi:FAD-binding oxidoreductase, partial [Candidatus Pelagibacter sp.]|nr:FAD-binding oxidoreductase [Candidatus Pelagibacter sp.]